MRSFGPAFGGGDETPARHSCGSALSPKSRIPLRTSHSLARFPRAVSPWSGTPDRGRELLPRVRDEADELPNLSLSGSRAREELLTDYGHALALVMNLWFEGFPNTFLEGWAHGTPALSLRFDPDGVIERHGLGTAAGGSITASPRRRGRSSLKVPIPRDGQLCVPISRNTTIPPSSVRNGSTSSVH